MDRLDPAVLRRFDLKIQLDFLRPDQAGKLFIRVLAIFQGYTRPRRYAESVKMRLSKLRTLTPGDFATVVRQECAEDGLRHRTVVRRVGSRMPDEGKQGETGDGVSFIINHPLWLLPRSRGTCVRTTHRQRGCLPAVPDAAQGGGEG